MARSQESGNKRENEKKRKQKAKEKEERREERKASSTKGQGLDMMMAYVDENGNLSDTPPDPTKMKSVELEDIPLGAARRDEEPQDDTRTGTVTFFNDAKGYGFIKDARTGESIFVHINGALDPLSDGLRVSFTTERTPKGMAAVGVKKA